MEESKRQLIDKYLNNTITKIELTKLCDWLKKESHQVKFEMYLRDLGDIHIVFQELNHDKAFKSTLVEINNRQKPIRHLNTKWMKYAAAILVVVTSSYFFLTKDKVEIRKNSSVNIDSNTSAEKDRVTLTLEDGTDILLEKKKQYVSNNVEVRDEKIIYKPIHKPTIAHNYLSISRGVQYSLQLSDGTKIWLNSESKLKYPVSFTEGKTREVELVYGEAFFEVAPSIDHNGSKFIVINQNQEVEVLGTQFNIKAYENEDYIYTTLVEGKVSVSNLVQKQNLIPNQQSKINILNKDFIINKVNVYNEVSWREGVFSFKSKTLSEIMMVLSRWYDFEIAFTNPAIKEDRFHGVLHKNDKIEEILKEFINSKFINDYEIKDNKISIK